MSAICNERCSCQLWRAIFFECCSDTECSVLYIVVGLVALRVVALHTRLDCRDGTAVQVSLAFLLLGWAKCRLATWLPAWCCTSADICRQDKPSPCSPDPPN